MKTTDQIESRREFIKRLGAVSLSLIAVRSAFSVENLSTSEPIDLLVVGDSVIWGQGLEERDKFYSLTAEWLRSTAFGSKRDVRVKVKAHSGSTIKMHQDEAAGYKKAGRDEGYYYKPEVNVGSPSIWYQIGAASEEYKAAGVAKGADIIMLSGGITDISVAKLLDPFGDDSKLPELIEKSCGDGIFELLERSRSLYPQALIVVVGYFPILSSKTDGGKLFNGWLESMAFPRFLKSLANNPLTRSVFFRDIRRKTINRSRIWFSESSKQMKAAVDRFNHVHGGEIAVFVPSPITEETCLETPDTLLFRMGKMGRSEDPLFAERSAECRTALPELKRSTGLNYPVRYCEIAAIGHPNQAGARAYADSIITAISPKFLNGR